MNTHREATEMNAEYASSNGRQDETLEEWTPEAIAFEEMGWRMTAVEAQQVAEYEAAMAADADDLAAQDLAEYASSHGRTRE